MNGKIKALLEKPTYNLDDLRTITEILRSDEGCPWDREQTHKSIRNNFIEETYEAVEAIDSGDVPLLREELGDVMLQVFLHARISEEVGEFTLDDVADEICRKLIGRHPHVFGDVSVSGTGDVLRNWDEIKQQTKGRETLREKLEGVSRALPSLMRAGKLARRAKKAGVEVFDDSRADYDGFAGKKVCVQIADTFADVPDDKLAETAGDALLAVAAAAEIRGVDAEQALYDACGRFIARTSKD